MTQYEYIESLVAAITSVMTEEQLSVKLKNGLSMRQMLAHHSSGLSAVMETAARTKSSADTGRIKAYWHPSGFLAPRKPNAEWLPLVVDGEEALT